MAEAIVLLAVILATFYIVLPGTFVKYFLLVVKHFAAKGRSVLDSNSAIK